MCREQFALAPAERPVGRRQRYWGTHTLQQHHPSVTLPATVFTQLVHNSHLYSPCKDFKGLPTLTAFTGSYAWFHSILAGLPCSDGLFSFENKCFTSSGTQDEKESLIQSTRSTYWMPTMWQWLCGCWRWSNGEDRSGSGPPGVVA